jgi:hypothetical protein
MTHPSANQQALVASSEAYTGAEAPRVYGTDKGWQRECYRFYSIIGEARYAAQYYGNALSKCTLNMKNPVIEENTLRWENDFTSTEAQFLDDMFAGKENQAQMLHDIGVHLKVAGECFIIGRQTLPPGMPSLVGDGSVIWEVISPLEVSTNGTFWTLKYEGYPDIVLTEDDTVIRVWQPDPYLRMQADSPFKSMLPVLREIENLDLHVNAQLISRITSAGIMWVPEGMDLPAPKSMGKSGETANGPTKLMQIIADTGAAVLRNPGTPAARVPVIIQVPDDVLDKMGKITEFWSPLDEHSGTMRFAAIHRFASGMDLPNELVEGMSSNGGTGGGSSNGVSHWGAWQIEESGIKLHIEPTLELIANAITVSYIRIQVEGTKQKVGGDAAGLKLRPDRSKEAFQLWDRGILSDEAVLRENGFDTSDLPNKEQQKAWLIRKIATGSNTPEQVAYAAEVIGVNIPSGVVEHPAIEAKTPEAPPPPSLVEHPTRPRDPSEQAAGLRVACNAMVLTALARVGNRLIQSGVKPANTPTYAVHCAAVKSLDCDKLLDGAFPLANEMLAGTGYDPADVMPALSAYVEARVRDKIEHDPDFMMAWLKTSGVVA